MNVKRGRERERIKEGWVDERDGVSE